MGKNNGFSQLMKSAVEVTQLGFSVVTPIVLLTILGVYLKNRFNLSDYVVIIFVLLGLCGGINSFVLFVKRYLKNLDKDKHKER
ncbi:MAG: AtpZ/AtpI family protein [Oscillospiraceae bacterium]